jgi:hypothetical protein
MQLQIRSRAFERPHLVPSAVAAEPAFSADKNAKATVSRANGRVKNFGPRSREPFPACVVTGCFAGELVALRIAAGMEAPEAEQRDLALHNGFRVLRIAGQRTIERVVHLGLATQSRQVYAEADIRPDISGSMADSLIELPECVNMASVPGENVAKGTTGDIGIRVNSKYLRNPVIACAS